MTFNPNFAEVCGPEWRPTIAGSRPLDSNGIGWAAVGTPAVAETVDETWVRLAAVATPGRYLLEVYNSGDTEATDLTTTVFLPTDDLQQDNWRLNPGRWTGEPGDVTGSGTLYTFIDDDPDAPIDSNYLTAVDGDDDYGDRYAFNVDTTVPGAFPNDRRVKQVRLYATCSSFGDTADFYLTDGTTPVYIGSASFGGVGIETVFSIGEINPLTSAPWTPDDVRGLASATGFAIVHNTKGGTNFERARVEVDHVAENRQAVACRSLSAVAAGEFAAFTMQHFTGSALADGWDKEADQAIEVWLRRTVDPAVSLVPSGSIAWAYLGRDVCPNAGWSTATFQVDDGGCLIADTVTAYADQAFALSFLVGSDWSTDSQPYAALSSTPCHFTVYPRQLLTIGADGDYGRLRVLVQCTDDATAAIAATVRLQSDDSAVGTATLLPATALALPDLGNGWRLWDDDLSSVVSLLDGDAVYIEFTTLAVPSRGWAVAVLDAVSDVFGPATFGGTTDEAVIDSTGVDRYDLAVTIGVRPYPPSLVEAALDTVALGETAGTRCGISALSLAKITWEPSVLGADFGYYLVQRSDDGEVTWADVQQIDDESTVEWDDREALRGVPTSWRMQVARADGTLSTPSPSATLTVPADADWMLVSNESPELSLGYSGAPARKWEPSINGQVERPLYGRDNLAVFDPLERPGDRFQMSLTVGAIDPTTVGRAAFAPLDDLCYAPLSYVCALDRFGHRWLVALRPISYEHTEGGHRHFATIEAVECATLFSVTGTATVTETTDLPTGTATLIDSTDVATGFSAPAGSFTPAPGGGDPWAAYTNGYKYLVHIDDDEIPDIEVYAAFKVHTGSGHGVVVLGGGEYGTNWWSTRDDDNELWIQTDLRDKGYDAVQLQWQTAAGSLDGWIGTPIGVRRGFRWMASRVAVLLRQIYADFVDPGTIHNGANHYAVTEQSAGGGGLEYARWDYGLGDIIQVAGCTGAMPLAAIEKLARGDDQYAAGTGALQIIDAPWGFAPDGTGPAQLREDTRMWWAWLADDVGARGTSDWPTTRCFYLGGAEDDSGSAPAAHDYLAKLRPLQPTRDFPRIKVTDQAHQLSTRGLRLLGHALRGEPFQLWSGGRNLGGVHDNIDLRFGQDSGASGEIAGRGLVLPGSVIVGVVRALTPLANNTTSLPGWTALTPFEIGGTAFVAPYWKIADDDDAAASDSEAGLTITFTTASAVKIEAAGAVLWVPPGHTSTRDLAYVETELAAQTGFTLGTIPPTPATDLELLLGIVGTGAATGGFTKPTNPWEDDYRGDGLMVTTLSIADGTVPAVSTTWPNSVAAEGRIYSWE